MQQLAHQIELSSDVSVIGKILNGESAVFAILIRRYNPVLYKIARSYGFNHQDAEDLVQDTHIAAYVALKKFQGRASYKTWISTILVNKCLYKLRHGYFKNEISSQQLTGSGKQPGCSHVDEAQTEKELLNRELAVILERSLQNIPILYKTTFVLRVVEGFSVAETAKLLQISSMNVRIRLKRAKNLLQKQVLQFYSGADLYPFNRIYCDAIVAKVFERMANMHE